jgi:hypothetical protein
MSAIPNPRTVSSRFNDVTTSNTISLRPKKIPSQRSHWRLLQRERVEREGEREVKCAHDFEDQLVGFLVDEHFLVHDEGEAVELGLRGVEGSKQGAVVGADDALHVVQGGGDAVDVVRGVLCSLHHHVLHVVRLRGKLLARDEQDHAAATESPNSSITPSTAHTHINQIGAGSEYVSTYTTTTESRKTTTRGAQK